MSTRLPSDLPITPFASAAEWRRWLRKNHGSAPGLWLKIAKADSGIDTVSYPQALEVALCFGWIDGRKEALDDRFWLQRFTPRRPGSRWSRINRQKAERLIAEEKMAPAGMREVELARRTGAWDRAYESGRTAVVPDDLERKLRTRPVARKFFESLSSANRYAILYRIQDAKRPETRARRIEGFIEMLENGEVLHPPRGGSK